MTNKKTIITNKKKEDLCLLKKTYKLVKSKLKALPVNIQTSIIYLFENKKKRKALLSIKKPGHGLLVEVDPKSINHVITRKAFLDNEQYDKSLFVFDGGWDLSAKPRGIYHCIQELFIDKKPYSETKEYMSLVKRVEGGLSAQGCKTLDDIPKYLLGLHDVYESIKKDGYKSQQELGSLEENEIKVLIDRKGNLCISGGGNHRHGMAKILKIPSVPVLIIGIHYLYLKSLANKTGVATSDHELLDIVKKNVANN